MTDEERQEFKRMQERQNRLYTIVIDGDDEMEIYPLYKRQQADESFQKMVIEELRGIKDLVVEKNDEVKKIVDQDSKLVLERIAEISLWMEGIQEGPKNAFSKNKKRLMLTILSVCFIIGKVIGDGIEWLVNLIERKVL